MEKREDTWIQVYGKSNGGCNVDKEPEAGKPEIIYVDGPDEYKIGKQLETDLTLLTEYFTFTTNEPCSSLSSTDYKCFNNDTYFILDFKTISHSCISAIVIESYPLDGKSYNTKSSIYCQKGGIGRNYCKLVFRKKEKREDASVTVYGILDPKACSLKERYIDSEPARRDAFGLTYYFLEKDGWSYYQPNLEKFTPQTRRETFQYKDGLINKPIYYLDRSDKYKRVREAFPTTKVHYITLKNSGPEKISFLDVYWFQEAQSENPKMPYVYFQGHCDSTKPSCILVLDSEPGNQITYAFVKVFRNKNTSNMLRIREEDLGRGR
uniref:Lufaxin n=1 Tax=Sergentomyia schwetzi TaxID=114605 RepID=A0A6B9VJP4_9DIPT|nr:lufaxin [Sergentomyia schwetzi]